LHEEKLNRDVYLYHESFLVNEVAVYIRDKRWPVKEAVGCYPWYEADSLKINSFGKYLMVVSSTDSSVYNTVTGEVQKEKRNLGM
jgi:hypothetical protein